VSVKANADYQMANFYRSYGFEVVETTQRRSFSWMFGIFSGTLLIANCVGLVKTILSIHTFSWTPYSLYKELTK